MIGIDNHNNTCYINVCLQCLLHIDDLINYMNIFNKKEHKLINEIINVFNLLKDNNKSVDILELLCEIENYSNDNNIKEYIDTSKQSDANEFLIFLLNVIHKLYSNKVNIKYIGEIKTINDKLAIKSIDSLNKCFKNEYSFIVQLFYGQFFCIYNKTINFEPFNNIYLDITENTDNIYDCMDNFIKEELINDKKKTMLFWSFPKYLIICFNRYINKNKLIEYPIYNLDFNKYTKGYKKDNQFNLISIINHIGSNDYGHYYMYNIYDDKCILFNDDIVNEVDIKKIDKNNTYLLIYKKI